MIAIKFLPQTTVDNPKKQFGNILDYIQFLLCVIRARGNIFVV